MDRSAQQGERQAFGAAPEQTCRTDPTSAKRVKTLRIALVTASSGWKRTSLQMRCNPAPRHRIMHDSGLTGIQILE
jgi:hypothetical protein